MNLICEEIIYCISKLNNFNEYLNLINEEKMYVNKVNI